MRLLRRIAFALMSGVIVAVVAVAVQDTQRERRYYGWTSYTPDGPVREGYWDLEAPAGKIAIIWFVALVLWAITQRRLARRALGCMGRGRASARPAGGRDHADRRPALP